MWSRGYVAGLGCWACLKTVCVLDWQDGIFLRTGFSIMERTKLESRGRVADGSPTPPQCCSQKNMTGFEPTLCMVRAVEQATMNRTHGAMEGRRAQRAQRCGR